MDGAQVRLGGWDAVMDALREKKYKKPVDAPPMVLGCTLRRFQSGAEQ
jgi:hypothetical protein